MKDAAFTQFAFHPYATTQGLHQTCANSQPQPCPPVLAGNGTILLREGLKNSTYFVRRNTYATVAHGKVQHGFGIRPGTLATYLQRDFPALGKFNGIAHDVDQNLPQAPRIADDTQGYIGRHSAHQCQTLVLRPHGKYFLGLDHTGLQIEGDVLNFQLACFNLGEVQDVVNDPQQGVRRRFDDTDKLALLRVQRGIQQQVGHANHPVHGRADLMAHIGQKVRLRPAGGLRIFLGFLQVHRRLLGRADIGEIAIPHPGPVGQLARTGLTMHPHSSSRVLVHHAHIHRLRLRFGIGRRQATHKQRAVIGMHTLAQQIRVLHDLLGADTGNGLDGLAHEGNSELATIVHKILEHGDRNVVRDLPQPRICFLDFGHIQPDAGKHRSAMGSQLWLGVYLCSDPAQATVPKSHTVFIAPHFALLGCTHNAFEHALAIVFFNLPIGKRGIRQQGLRVNAQNTGEAIAYKGVFRRIAQNVRLKHHAGHRIRNMPQTLFGSLDGCFHALALGDIGANGNEHAGLASIVAQRDYGGIHPVQVPRLGPVTDLTVPHLPRVDGAPQIGEKFRAM